MLNKIKSFFESSLSGPGNELDEQHRLKVATAALLIEMMLQDEDAHDTEKQAILKALQEKFELSADETHELFQLAEEERKDATDYHQFTSLIAENYTQSQKIRVIEYLWSVAFADGVLDKYEEHMVRRIADLIHVSHRDFLQTKHKFESQ